MVSSLCRASFVALALAARPTTTPEAAIAIAVDLTALGARSPRELRGMVGEASAIWEGHGLSVTWITTPEGRALPAPTHVLTVVEGRCTPDRGCAAPPERPAVSPRLGAVVFFEGRTAAESSLVIAVDTIERLVATTTWANRRVADWPPAAQADLVGRALGRVLAHEMGHYLLAWRAHTARGLMRSEFSGEALVHPDRGNFKVPESLLPRLRARLAQLSTTGSTVAAIQ